MPPVVEKTRGVNDPSSTSRTLCSYCLCFSLSCRWYIEASRTLRYDWVFGLKTLTSKNACWCRLPQRKTQKLQQKQGCYSTSSQNIHKLTLNKTSKVIILSSRVHWHKWLSHIGNIYSISNIFVTTHVQILKAMVSGESGALCEAVPIELYCLHCNGWQLWLRRWRCIGNSRKEAALKSDGGSSLGEKSRSCKLMTRNGWMLKTQHHGS